MAKGKKNKVKTVASKKGKGAHKNPAHAAVAHDNATETAAQTTPAASPEMARHGVAGAKVVGFTNLGNTCFFNSVLQVLVASPPLQHFFSQPNAKTHPGPLGGAMQEMFDQTYSEPEAAVMKSKGDDKASKAKKQKQKGCYAPQRLLTAVCKAAPHFKGFQQQDSHELLRVLLDGLQTEEAKAMAAKLKYKTPQQAEEGEEGSKAAPQGFLSEVFGGELSSRVACEVCHHTSVTLEPFMDLSLPIPSGTLADMDDSTPDRREQRLKRAVKGKKGKKGEEDADAPSSVARDEAQPGTKLKHKQKKKLLKEEKKASKLERRRAKNGSAAADSSQTTAAHSASAPSSTATAEPDAAADDHHVAQPLTQPAQTSKSNSNEAAAVNESTPEAREAGSSIVPNASDQVPAGKGELEPQHEGNSQHQQLSISTDTSHAEPQDVLHEFASLSPMLPDMPKRDMQDDLAGLFQAAFATCHKEMSPRRPPPESPFSSHDQDCEEEDYSLYNDADEAMGRDQADGAALDASDEEEGEKSGEMAGALLEGFIGDSEHAAQISTTAQADDSDDACANIGSLFDESAAEATDSAHFQDFGAAEGEDVTDEQATASGGANLQSCLAEFFQQEHITWECPGEKKVKKELRRNSLGADNPPATPDQLAGEYNAKGKRETRHTVSFSEEEPVVTLIPGSVEQRGQVYRTSDGNPPFCRPLRTEAAFVLLTAAPDAHRPTRMHINIQPQDEEEATLMLASTIRHLATADVPAPKVGDDEEEVQLAQAQVLMDCMADLLSQKGLDGTRAWCEGGLKLRCRSRGQASSWIVLGQLPQEEGQGRWEYPSPTDPSQICTDSEADLLSSQGPLTSSSFSSSNSSSSSAADRQDNSNLDSMLGMISSNRRSPNSTSQEEATSSPDPSSVCKHLASGQDRTTAVDPAVSEGSSSTAGHVSEAQSATSGDGNHSSHESDLDTTHHHLAQQQASTRNLAATGTDAETNGVSSGSRPVDSCSGQHTDEGVALPGASEYAAEDAIGSESSSSEATQSPAAASQRGAATLQSAATSPEAGIQPANSASEKAHPADQLTCVDRETREQSASGSASAGASNEAVPASGDAPKENGTSGKQQDENVQHNAKEEAPRTPIKKLPKKGGLVNVQRPAVKGYSIHRCPPLLTVHVKRFQQDLRGRLSKIAGAVAFPINLNLTPFCDPKGCDAKGARYSLLGFVEHQGSMRSGHYVAFVQRGMGLSNSPHLHSLLHKHGIAAEPAPTSQASSDTPPPPHKKHRKAASTRPASTAQGSKASEGKAGNAGTHSPAALAAATSAPDTPISKAGVPASSSPVQPASTVHLNGKVGTKHGVPDDWESSDGGSTNESQTEASSGPATIEVDGGSRPTDAAPSNADAIAASSSAQTHSSTNDSPALHSSACVSQATDSDESGTGLRQSIAKQQPSRQEKVAASVVPAEKQSEQRSWYYISDTQVKMVSEADILTREVYILLYMRTT